MLDVQVYRLQDDEGATSAALMTLAGDEGNLEDNTAYQMRAVTLPNVNLDGLWES